MRTQATISAIINMIVNPAITWLSNREMAVTPLTDVLVDMSITCLIMSTVIAFFMNAGVKRDLKSGNIRLDAPPPSPSVLLRLPRSWASLGLLLGFGFAILLVPVTLGIFTVFGLSKLSFGWLIVFKIAYTGAIAYLVTRWIILRQLQAT
ncbi:MAG: hypothetical protein EOM24_24470 [Chloroflexia bacterium]|nr:hypothetical protein [Chloroflexia bacterium]